MNPFLRNVRFASFLTMVAMAGNTRGAISASASALRDNFAVQSFGLGVDRRPPPGTAGGTADINIGVGELREIYLEKKLDTASVWLCENALKGLSVGGFVFTFSESDASGSATYLIIGVEGARVQSWKTAAGRDERPVEQVTLHYHRLHIETFSKVDNRYVSDGIHGWDLDASTPWIPSSVEELTARNDSGTISEDNSGILDVLANDETPSGEELLITGASVPDRGGTVVIAADQRYVRYVPAADFFGEEIFLYTVGDGMTADKTARVRIIVGAVNDLPVAKPDRLAITQRSTHTLPVAFLTVNDEDTEGDALKIAEVDAMTELGGAARIWRSDWIVYTPPASFLTGQVDSFHYWVTDGTEAGQGEPALQRGVVTIALQRTSDDEIIHSLTASMSRGDTLRIRVQGVPGATYLIEKRNRIDNESSWSKVGEVITDSFGQAEYSQPVSGDEDQEYFRAVPGEP